MISHIYVIEGKGSFGTFEEAKEAVAKYKLIELLEHIGIRHLHDDDHQAMVNNLGMFTLLYQELEDIREEV